MRIDILTVVPELLDSPLSHSIVGRAIKKGLVEIHVHNIRKYGLGPRATVDDYCYGGDAGDGDDDRAGWRKCQDRSWKAGAEIMTKSSTCPPTASV